MLLRDAIEADLDGITAIYNDAVAHTTAIWNEKPVDRDDRARWFAVRRAAGYPVLVAEADDGSVAGYATFGDWRPFEGYRHTVEHSVYVAAGARGRGIGEALMRDLLLRARLLRKHAMVAGIEAGNAASIRLHEKLGFVRVGLMPEVGCKFGRWLDLAFLQLVLDDRRDPDGV